MLGCGRGGAWGFGMVGGVGREAVTVKEYGGIPLGPRCQRNHSPHHVLVAVRVNVITVVRVSK